MRVDRWWSRRGRGVYEGAGVTMTSPGSDCPLAFFGPVLGPLMSHSLGGRVLARPGQPQPDPSWIAHPPAPSRPVPGHAGSTLSSADCLLFELGNAPGTRRVSRVPCADTSGALTTLGASMTSVIEMVSPHSSSIGVTRATSVTLQSLLAWGLVPMRYLFSLSTVRGHMTSINLPFICCKAQ